MDRKTSKYSWVILALTNPQFALDLPRHSPRKHKWWGARCGGLRRLQGFEGSQPQPAQIAAFVLPFLVLEDWMNCWKSHHFWSSLISAKPQIYFFSSCWIKDAANGSWFTSDWMDLAEWFNSSPAAGCRKILSHFTERMFLLSFLVITYLHELAQLGGSGGSCVAPSVCISYHWFGGQIIKPRII